MMMMRSAVRSLGISGGGRAWVLFFRPPIACAFLFRSTIAVILLSWLGGAGCVHGYIRTLRVARCVGGERGRREIEIWRKEKQKFLEVSLMIPT